MGDVDTKKVLFVALSVCLVCAVIVSASSVLLRPMQKVNKELDLKKNILDYFFIDLTLLAFFIFSRFP